MIDETNIKKCQVYFPKRKCLKFLMRERSDYTCSQFYN